MMAPGQLASARCDVRGNKEKRRVGSAELIVGAPLPILRGKASWLSWLRHFGNMCR
jgi:hypothetical protein